MKMNMNFFKLKVAQAVFLSLAILHLPKVNAQNHVSQNQFLKSLDNQIPGWLEEFIVPGAAIAIIENGEVIFKKGYGFADKSKNKRVEHNTGFNVASISKTFTAWGVMKLVEEGKINLDDPVEKYLSRWKIPSSSYDTKGVTIRRLLSHTAGLSIHGYAGRKYGDSLPTLVESLEGKNRIPENVEIVIEPGKELKYSGGGYTVLQLMIEEVTGKSFEDYMESSIFKPIGMKNSGFELNKLLEKSSLEYDTDGDLIPFEIFTAKAAAGLHTTLEDFIKFALANVSPERQNILAPSSLEMMMTPAPSTKGRYGLGYGITPVGKTENVMVGHSGGNMGWKSYYMINPKTKDGFIMITNGGSGDNVYRQAYCQWYNWNYGFPMEEGLCKKDAVPILKTTLKLRGIPATLDLYKRLKSEEGSVYVFNPGTLNTLGFDLLKKGKKDDAIQIFQLNKNEYPKSWMMYNSLGQAYMENGEVTSAITNFKKSLELNPKNEYGRQQIEKLEKEQK